MEDILLTMDRAVCLAETIRTLFDTGQFTHIRFQIEKDEWHLVPIANPIKIVMKEKS